MVTCAYNPSSGKVETGRSGGRVKVEGAGQPVWPKHGAPGPSESPSLKNKTKQKQVGAVEIAQLEKLTAKPDKLSSIPGIHQWKKRTDSLPRVVLQPPHNTLQQQCS